MDDWPLGLAAHDFLETRFVVHGLCPEAHALVLGAAKPKVNQRPVERSLPFELGANPDECGAAVAVFALALPRAADRHGVSTPTPPAERELSSPRQILPGHPERGQ